MGSTSLSWVLEPWALIELANASQFKTYLPSRPIESKWSICSALENLNRPLSMTDWITQQNTLQWEVLWSKELCHLQYVSSSKFWIDGKALWSMIPIKLFLSKISNTWSQKVKSKVYFDFLSWFFCGVGFKARQMNGLDLTSIQLATLLQWLLRSFTFHKLPLSALLYKIMCWPIESEFTLSWTNKLLFSIDLLQPLAWISLIDAEIDIV